MNKDNEKYLDIINLPHHISKRHKPMSRQDRAAQFSPFAALTGFEKVTKEEARFTEAKHQLDENALALLNEKLFILKNCINEKPEITVTYFKPDDKKAGGEYIKIKTIIKKIDSFNKALLTEDKLVIPFNSIESLEGDIFNEIDFI